MAAAQGRDLSGSSQDAASPERRPGWLTPARRRVLRRSFKVALAATIATFIAKSLHLPVPWFATISAIVVGRSEAKILVSTADPAPCARTAASASSALNMAAAASSAAR